MSEERFPAGVAGRRDDRHRRDAMGSRIGGQRRTSEIRVQAGRDARIPTRKCVDLDRASESNHAARSSHAAWRFISHCNSDRAGRKAGGRRSDQDAATAALFAT